MVPEQCYDSCSGGCFRMYLRRPCYPHLWHALLPALVFVLAIPARALDPHTRIRDYLHTTWTNRDGLPQSSVQGIIQSRDGSLWLTTRAGMTRFDGRRFTLLTPENTPGLKRGYVTAALEDRNGVLWVALYHGDFVGVKDGKGTTYGRAEGLLSGAVGALLEDHDGSLWIAGDGGLNHLAKGAMTGYPAADLLTKGMPISMYRDEQDRLWIAAGVGFSVLDHGRFKRFELREDGRDIFPIGMTADGEGGFWVGTDRGLFRYRNGGFARWRLAQVDHRVIRSILREADGGLWLATTTGLCRVRGQLVDCYSARDGLTAESAAALLLDRNGGLWVGTKQGGLDHFRDPAFRTYAERDGFPANMVWSVIQDHSGAMWFGTNHGLVRMVCDAGTSVPHCGAPQMLYRGNVYGVQEDGDGAIWFGTGQTLRRLYHGKIKVFLRADGIAGRVLAICVTSRGEILAGSAVEGVFRLEGAKLVPYIRLPAMVTSILEARDGTLWIGTEGQLFHWQAGRLTPYGGRDYYSSAYEDRDGTIWAASWLAGLVRIRDGRLAKFTAPAELAYTVLYKVFEDDSGNMYLTSSSGVFRLPKKALDQATGLTDAVILDESDGMNSRDCNGGVQNAGWKSRDGRFWIPTTRGVAVLDPAHIPNISAPVTEVEQALVDQRPVPVALSAHVAAGPRVMQFRYKGISLGDAQVRYRYRLEGFDPGWVNAGLGTDASYTNLAAGPYRFRVQARNREGSWAEASAFSFTVEPHVYRTWWFYTLCSLAAAILIVAWHFRRISELKARLGAAADAKIEERSRIAREVHDTLLQGLTGAALMLEAALPNMRDAQLRDRVSGILTRIQRAMRETRWALTRMRQSDDNLSPDLAAALRGEAQRLAFEGGFQFLFESGGEITDCSPEARGELVRIAQEAVANAVRYSGGSSISMRVGRAGHSIVLSVEDNGQGFDPQAARTGNGKWGISGMRERAANIGGRLEIVSAPDLGTKVIVEVPGVSRR
jgi:signal transduction histidine kinase/ligand-binding sensor domain-containing protein